MLGPGRAILGCELRELVAGAQIAGMGLVLACRLRIAPAGRSFDEQFLVETDNVPLRKYGEPGEVATVEGLLSPLSDRMTGLNILHDGGFTRAY